MSINERISKIKQYFVGLNVTEGIAYVIVKFPSTWKVPNSQFLLENYKVNVGTIENGRTLFASEIDNTMDVVFDAVDYTITFNREAEERSTILKTKIKELTELFATEDIEKLKTLTFTFGRKYNNKTKNTKKEDDSLIQNNEVNESEDVSENTNNTPMSDDNSLMAMAKSMIGE